MRAPEAGVVKSSLLVRSTGVQLLVALFFLTTTCVSVYSSLRILQASPSPETISIDARAAPTNPSSQNSSNEISPLPSIREEVKDVTTLEESEHATVMAFAMNYDLYTHKKYVGSLRKSGFKGNIILGVEAETKPGVRDYLMGKGVTMRSLTFVNCTYIDSTVKTDNSHDKERRTCAHPYPDIKVRWSRFPLIRDWLTECKECTGPVLISDYRDAYFQRNPFAVGEPAIRGLQVFEEHRSIHTTHWLVQVPVSKCKGASFDEPMLCSGTTVGDRESMLKYLSAMYGEMRLWMADPKCHFSMNGDDQSIHNYLFYSGKLPFANKIPNRSGIVHTVGAQGSIILKAHRKRHMDEKGIDQGKATRTPYDGADDKTWIGFHHDLTDNDGFFVNMDGSRSHVIHQYDRFGPNFEGWLARQMGKVWE
uniref:Uncharacterized protein n=1 Tax=Trieres chinensis TaxID=1514140 RepID=A0A7S2A6F2_TRICV